MTLKIKNANNEYQKTCLLFLHWCSKISNGTKAIKIKGNIPREGQEKANNNPLSKANNNLFIYVYKYYDIFADVNVIKRNIPNLITLANLSCGLLSIIFVFQGSLKIASSFIFIGALLDFFDGFTARILKTTSAQGKQLDSMADLVTFGVATGFVLFFLIDESLRLMFQQQYFESILVSINSVSENGYRNTIIKLSPLVALLIPLCSAYRLANFNIDKKQTSSFIGLPTPALAIFIAAIAYIDLNQYPIFGNWQTLTIIAITMPILLIIKVPLFSLKFNGNQSINSRVNIFRILLILVAIVLFFIFGFAATPFIVILYLILSLLNNIL